MKTYVAKLDWNKVLRNNTAIVWWNILKYKIMNIMDRFVPLEKINGLERYTFQKKVFEYSIQLNNVEDFYAYQKGSRLHNLQRGT